MAGSARWLLIIRHDRAELAGMLGARYPDARVIIDRRRGERRHRTEPFPIERRDGDRRETLSVADRVMWESLGYRLVYAPAPATLPVPA